MFDTNPKYDPGEMDKLLKDTGFADVCDDLDESSKLIMMIGIQYFKIFQRFFPKFDEEGKALFNEFDKYFYRLITLEQIKITALRELKEKKEQ